MRAENSPWNVTTGIWQLLQYHYEKIGMDLLIAVWIRNAGLDGLESTHRTHVD